LVHVEIITANVSLEFIFILFSSVWVSSLRKKENFKFYSSSLGSRSSARYSCFFERAAADE